MCVNFTVVCNLHWGKFLNVLWTFAFIVAWLELLFRFDFVFGFMAINDSDEALLISIVKW